MNRERAWMVAVGVVMIGAVAVVWLAADTTPVEQEAVGKPGDKDTSTHDIEITLKSTARMKMMSDAGTPLDMVAWKLTPTFGPFDSIQAPAGEEIALRPYDVRSVLVVAEDDLGYGSILSQLEDVFPTWVVGQTMSPCRESGWAMAVLTGGEGALTIFSSQLAENKFRVIFVFTWGHVVRLAPKEAGEFGQRPLIHIGGDKARWKNGS